MPDLAALQGHPKLGASWEGFALEQIVALTGGRNAYFWATQSRAELDLMVLAQGKRWGFEIKYQDAPVMTKSLHVALEDLKLERAWIVYPGQENYPVHAKVRVCSLKDVLKELANGEQRMVNGKTRTATGEQRAVGTTKHRSPFAT